MSESLCDTCRFDRASCMPDRVVCGIDLDPSARDEEAGKVVKCNGYYAQRKPWIGVDFDGTLVTYDEWRGVGVFGDPIQLMVNRVKKWLAEGRRVKILTARALDGEDRAAVRAWTLEFLGVELEVTAQKDYMMIELWDDRAIQVEPNTGHRVCRDEALKTRIGELEEALRWYRDRTAGCRKIGSLGEPDQHALSNDGGARARAVLGD